MAEEALPLLLHRLLLVMLAAKSRFVVLSALWGGRVRQRGRRRGWRRGWRRRWEGGIRLYRRLLLVWMRVRVVVMSAAEDLVGNETVHVQNLWCEVCGRCAALVVVLVA